MTCCCRFRLLVKSDNVHIFTAQWIAAFINVPILCCTMLPKVVFVFFAMLIYSGFVVANTEIPATTGSAVLGQGYNTDDQSLHGYCQVFDNKKVFYAGGAEGSAGFSTQN